MTEAFRPREKMLMPDGTDSKTQVCTYPGSASGF